MPVSKGFHHAVHGSRHVCGADRLYLVPDQGRKGAHDWTILALLIGIWLAAAVGITLKCRFPGCYDRLAILLYLGMGWSGALALGPISQNLPWITIMLIIAGGVIYSAGVVFHVWERLRFQNAIWHGFVVTAAAVHYSAVLTVFSL